MILILGGTTEGRTAVKVADEAGKPYFYSTKGEWQKIQCKHGIRITGGMNTEKMEVSAAKTTSVYWWMLPTRLPPNSTGLWMKQAGHYIFLSYVLKGSILHAPKHHLV